MRLVLTPHQVTELRPRRSHYGAGAPLLVTTLATSRGKASHQVVAGPVPDGVVAWPAVCIDEPVTLTLLDAFADTDGPWPRIEQIRLACALAKRLSATQIAALLCVKSRSEVWRWAALATASPALRDAVLGEHLAPGHLRPLLPLRLSDQAAWVTRAMRGRWSVRKLAAAIRREAFGKPDTDPNIAHWESQLSERLGSSVRIEWPEDPASPRRLVIGWFDIEALKGVLEALARGPDCTADPLPVRPRQLVIPLQSADELAALTQHLVDA